MNPNFSMLTLCSNNSNSLPIIKVLSLKILKKIYITGVIVPKNWTIFLKFYNFIRVYTRLRKFDIVYWYSKTNCSMW